MAKSMESAGQAGMNQSAGASQVNASHGNDQSDEIRRLRAENARLLAEQQKRSEPAADSHGSDRTCDPRQKQSWPFQVSAKPLTKGTAIPSPQTIVAVDEGEAIRLFCLRQKDGRGNKLPSLDPINFTFRAECTDPARKAQHQAKIARAVHHHEATKGMSPALAAQAVQAGVFSSGN